MIFRTYIRTVRVRKLITIPFIFSEFTCGKVSLLQKAIDKSRFHARCIFSHELEQCMKDFTQGCIENTGRSIYMLK